MLNMVVVTLLTMSCMLGACGNFIVVTVIVFSSQLHTPTNWYLANMSVCNIIISIVSLPLYIAFNIIQKDWPLGCLACRILLVSGEPSTSILPVEFLTGVCVFTHAGVAVTRYVTVRKLLHRRTTGEPTNWLKVPIMLTWMVSFLLISVPLYGALGTFNVTPHTSGRCCDITWYYRHSKYVYHASTFILTYIIPMLLTGLTHIKIHNMLKKQPSKSMTSRRRHPYREEANGVLVTAYVVFAATTFPLQVFALFIGLDLMEYNEMVRNITHVLVLVFHVHLVTTPLIIVTHIGSKLRSHIYNSPLWTCCLGDGGFDVIRTRLKGFGEKCKQTLNSSQSSSIRSQLTGLGTPTSTRVSIIETLKHGIKFHMETDGNTVVPQDSYSNNEQLNSSKNKPDSNNNTNASTKNTNKIIYSPSIKQEFAIVSHLNQNLAGNNFIISDEYLCDEFSDITAYYDDGSLMYIYDKVVGVVSLTHDDGRETCI